MIELKNITLYHVKNEKPLIKNFSFVLNQGDKVAIIGEEGNGKSTLLKLIYNSALVDNYCKWEGTINTKNHRIGYLEQTLNNKWDDYTVEEYFLKEDVDTEIDYDRYNDFNIFSSIMTRLNLSSDLLYNESNIKFLSGGEKVKIQIVKILYKDPDVLLFDEPTNDLDIDTLVWLENFIINLKVPIMYISHDETLLEKTANTIIHLEQLKKTNDCKHTIERIDYKSYIEKRVNLIKKTEQVALKQRSEYKEQQEKFQQIYQKVEHQQSTISRGDPHGAKLLKKKMKSLKSQEKRYDKEKEDFLDIPDVEEEIKVKFSNDIYISNDKNILELNLDSFKLNNDKEIKNIKLSIIGPKHIVIIGKNGIGKTTLLKYIYSLIKDRTDINVGYMPQDYNELMDDNQIAYKFISDTTDKEEITKIRTFMGSLKFTGEEMTLNIKNLSGGQKAKLYLLKLIMNNYNVLILDEPTRNLSPLSNPVIRKILSNYEGAIISISHDRKYINDVAHTIYELKEDGLFEIHKDKL